MDPAIKSSACSRSGASAVQAQAQALCDQALRQGHALRDQRHGAFPEVPSSAWFPGSPAPRGAKLAGSTLDQAPVAKAAVLRHDFHFVRGGLPGQVDHCLYCCCPMRANSSTTSSRANWRKLGF